VLSRLEGELYRHPLVLLVQQALRVLQALLVLLLLLGRRIQLVVADLPLGWVTRRAVTRPKLILLDKG